LTNPSGHLWRDKWNALSGPLSENMLPRMKAHLDDNEVAGVLVVRVPEDALCLQECPLTYPVAVREASEGYLEEEIQTPMARGQFT